MPIIQKISHLWRILKKRVLKEIIKRNASLCEVKKLLKDSPNKCIQQIRSSWRFSSIRRHFEAEEPTALVKQRLPCIFQVVTEMKSFGNFVTSEKTDASVLMKVISQNKSNLAHVSSKSRSRQTNSRYLAQSICFKYSILYAAKYNQSQKNQTNDISAVSYFLIFATWR